MVHSGQYTSTQGAKRNEEALPRAAIANELNKINDEVTNLKKLYDHFGRFEMLIFDTQLDLSYAKHIVKNRDILQRMGNIIQSHGGKQYNEA